MAGIVGTDHDSSVKAILNGLIGLLADAINLADYRSPARPIRKITAARRTRAILFLASVALLPLMVMAWWLW